MTVLVTGATGQVGTELVNRAAHHGVKVIGCCHHELDITNREAVHSRIREGRFSVVINAAAYTAVDRAESDIDTTYAVNRDGPENLARACAAASIPLIHLSTDYVFDGAKRTPYTEDDPVAPLSVYGKSKAAGEQAVCAITPEHIILRTCWVYSSHGRNFVSTMLRLGQERDEISVVDDQVGCPTAAGDIAEAILKIIKWIEAGKPVDWGTYHFCNAGKTNWYAFAAEIFKLASGYTPYNVTLRPIPAEDYPLPAQRPANSVLDCSRIERTFGIRRRPWLEALAETIYNILNKQ